MNAKPLAQIKRGVLTESLHRGHIAVVDSSGTIINALGNIDTYTYIRSAAKPIQNLPLITTGTADRFALSNQELSVMCASHNGEDIHVATVRNILAKAGLDENDLECGIHEPYDQQAKAALCAKGLKPSTLHNNCSGKHAGMLLMCQHMGWDLQGYVYSDHPLQKMLHQTIAEISDLSLSQIPTGIDGCGVVVFGLSVAKMAYLFAKMANPSTLPLKYQKAAQRITAAMIEYPEMVAGRGRLCTDLMTAAAGDLFSKGGAEGVYCLGHFPQGLGVAVKIEDGRSRALGTIIYQLLHQQNLLSQEKLMKLNQYQKAVLKNHRQEEVGYIETVFNL